jgi:hypothetical protein
MGFIEEAKEIEVLKAAKESGEVVEWRIATDLSLEVFVAFTVQTWPAWLSARSSSFGLSNLSSASLETHVPTRNARSKELPDQNLIGLARNIVDYERRVM